MENKQGVRRGGGGGRGRGRGRGGGRVGVGVGVEGKVGWLVGKRVQIKKS